MVPTRARMFLARLRRGGRRWIMEEATLALRDAQSLDELRALVTDATSEVVRRWAPVGTHAQTMGLAWRASLIVGSPLANAAHHLATLQALIRGRAQPEETPDHASIAWTYPVVVKGSVRFAWVWRAGGETTFPPAVYLSAVLGRLSGRLRLCRFCEGPFLAAYSWDRTCKACQYTRAKARRPEVRRILDRWRKRDPSQREKAREELRWLSHPKWKAKWDKRDPRGRRPQRHRRAPPGR